MTSDFLWIMRERMFFPLQIVLLTRGFD